MILVTWYASAWKDLPFFFKLKGFCKEKGYKLHLIDLGNKNVKKQENWALGNKGKIEAPEYLLCNLFKLWVQETECDDARPLPSSHNHGEETKL